MTFIKVNNQKPITEKFAPLFDEVLDNFLDGTGIQKAVLNRTPAVNIRETEKSYEIELSAPGYEKEEFRLNLSKNILTVSAEKKAENEEKKENYSRREFNYTSFKRSFTLPDSANDEGIHAEYKNGILFVSIPKLDAEKNKSRDISVS
jgi:HSP20 family protein